MREAKTRTIYSNYDLWDEWHEDAEEYLKDETGLIPSKSAIWEEIYNADEINWEYTRDDLERFFDNGSTYLAIGTVGRWDGTFDGGFIFNSFSQLMSKVGKDCDYFHFYDKNGHFFLLCSHHDGTNIVEVKRLTDRGKKYYENWNYGSSSRTERECHKAIFDRYSNNLNFVHSVYGAPKREYKKGK